MKLNHSTVLPTEAPAAVPGQGDPAARRLGPARRMTAALPAQPPPRSHRDFSFPRYIPPFFPSEAVSLSGTAKRSSRRGPQALRPAPRPREPGAAQLHDEPPD